MCLFETFIRYILFEGWYLCEHKQLRVLTTKTPVKKSLEMIQTIACITFYSRFLREQQVKKK